MNDRERFNEVMHYGRPDRTFFTDFDYTEDTRENWYAQGLPRDTRFSDYFGLDRFWIGPGVHVGLFPAFAAEIVEDRGDRVVERQANGVLVLRQKSGRTIPHHIDHLLKTRDDWNKHYKPRFDPATPGRYPADWDRRVAQWKDRDYPLVVGAGSLYGWLRDYMGMEALSYLVYDDPAWLGEMIETLADCILGTLERALSSGVRFDAASMWEDICFRNGPLISPRKFREMVVPHYRRITDRLAKAGVDVVYLDCDGDIRPLIDCWLQGGVNTMFPLEVGVWGLDPVALRKQYGRDLLMMGGFSKRILATSREAIAREIDRLTPLVDELGYIGFCDHRVSPDVPLENYDYYIDTVRRRWCRDINLRPRMVPIQTRPATQKTALR